MIGLRGELLAWLEAFLWRWPGGVGARLRAGLLARRLASLGARAWIGHDLLVMGHRSVRIGSDFTCWRSCVIAACDDGAVEIGDRVGLNQGAYLNACQGGRITIGDDVIIGPYSVLRASDHRFSDPAVRIADQGHVAGTITIEPDVWIAAHVTVVGGVRIGRGAVVAAGAVVTEDVEPMTVVGGVPARPIKRRGDGVASRTEEGSAS